MTTSMAHDKCREEKEKKKRKVWWEDRDLNLQKVWRKQVSESFLSAQKKTKERGWDWFSTVRLKFNRWLLLNLTQSLPFVINHLNIKFKVKIL